MKKLARLVLGKGLLLLIILSLGMGATAPSRAETQSPVITLDGERLAFPTAPINRDGITYVHAETLLEALGLEVAYPNDEVEASEAVIGGIKSGLFLVFHDDGVIEVNGTRHELKQSSFLHDGTRYIPLRFTAEASKAKVQWLPQEKRIAITTAPELSQIRLMLPESETLTAAQLQAMADYSATAAGVELVIEPTPHDHYYDRVMLRIAAGDILELTVLPEATRLPADMYRQVSPDLEPLLADYPHLSQLLESSLDELRQDHDGIRALPIAQSPADAAFPALRQDWLDRLGFVSPQTMDELAQVLQAFTDQDPDGNGKHDTYGLIALPETPGLEGFEWVDRIYNKNSSRFIEKDGAIVDTLLSAETREALAWLQQAYKNGWIHPEWATLSKEAAYEQLRDGSVGGAALTLEQAAALQLSWQDADNKALLSPLVSLQADSTAPAVTAQGKSYKGLLLFSLFTPQDKLEQLLTLLEQLATPGEESNTGKAALRQALLQTPSATLEDKLDEKARKQLEQVREQREAIISGQSAPILPQTVLTDAHDLAAYATTNDKIKQMRTKIILGASLSTWDDFVAKLQQDEDYKRMMEALN
ncbi:hypothetical protein PA598K_02807 [Paenibacillus sp. 598K]|uniref:extracellular solute-binding protein n=1 Tax=Paenibacillus sp. 598K TaxID=1117987 RepID=UPI000FF9D31E|nr:extracellular solute-binding protein [Paenibacillus sp. 598K]GBF74462.1 hypothetical protein PA598K_02807 [Paenibacillus sp. 598K]